MDHLHGSFSLHWRGTLENAKTGKRAQRRTNRPCCWLRGYPPQGCSQGPRAAVAPLTGARRVPGHTRSRASMHHCWSDLYAGADPLSVRFIPAGQRRRAPVDYSFRNEL